MKNLIHDRRPNIGSSLWIVLHMITHWLSFNLCGTDGTVINTSEWIYILLIFVKQMSFPSGVTLSCFAELWKLKISYLSYKTISPYKILSVFCPVIYDDLLLAQLYLKRHSHVLKTDFLVKDL